MDNFRVISIRGNLLKSPPEAVTKGFEREDLASAEFDARSDDEDIVYAVLMGIDGDTWRIMHQYVESDHKLLVGFD